MSVEFEDDVEFPAMMKASDTITALTTEQMLNKIGILTLQRDNAVTLIDRMESELSEERAKRIEAEAELKQLLDAEDADEDEESDEEDVTSNAGEEHQGRDPSRGG